MLRRLRVVFSDRAVADLQDINAWVADAARSARVARGYVARIRVRCRRIGNVPYGSMPREEYGPGIRSAVFEHSATILYRVEAERVLILRVLRAGRDVEGAARS